MKHWSIYAMKVKKGFTLVEVIIAMFITTVLISAVYFMFIRVFQMNREQDQFIQMQDSLRTVSIIVEKDIRKSTQNVDIKKEGNTTTLQYLDDTGQKLEGSENIFTYKLENNRLYRNGNFLMENLEEFELTNHNFYVNLELKSKTGKREVSHDKKIYLR